MHPKLQGYLDQFKTNDFFVSKLFSDASDEALSNRPNDTANSAHYIFGHILHYRISTCKDLGIDTGLDYSQHFAMDTDGINNGDYPPMEQLCKDWSTVSEKMYSGLTSLLDEKLDEAMEHSFPFSDKTMAGSISFIAYHETYHIGQLVYNRRVNGLSSLIG